jgi:hypothetical protein
VRSKKWRGVVAAAASLFLCVAMSGVASAAGTADPAPLAQAPGGVQAVAIHIQNGNSTLCLAARGTAPEAPVVQVVCGNYLDQLWYYVNPITVNGRQYWHIKNALPANTAPYNGGCLVGRLNWSAEVPAVTTTCGNFNDQLWFHSAQAVNGQNGQISSLVSGDQLCLVARTKNPETRAVMTRCKPQFADSLWTRF